MEAFEQFVALDLEADGLVVSEAIKFPVTRRTRREDRIENATHGYEVDLIGARSGLLVLATVKSFFGSRGVHVREVSGAGGNTRAYALLNDIDAPLRSRSRSSVPALAAQRASSKATMEVARAKISLIISGPPGPRAPIGGGRPA